MSFSKTVKTSEYIIQVKGQLDSHWEKWFGGMKITLADNDVTILSGQMSDQSALFGLLEAIHNLNLTLLSVQKVESERKTNNNK